MISNASASLHPFELGPSWILNFLIYLGRRRAAMEEERKRREERRGRREGGWEKEMVEETIKTKK